MLLLLFEYAGPAESFDDDANAEDNEGNCWDTDFDLKSIFSEFHIFLSGVSLFVSYVGNKNTLSAKIYQGVAVHSLARRPYRTRSFKWEHEIVYSLISSLFISNHFKESSKNSKEIRG